MKTASYENGRCNSCGHVRGEHHRTGCGWCEGILKREALLDAQIALDFAEQVRGARAQKMRIWAAQMVAVADGTAGPAINAHAVSTYIHEDIERGI